MTKIKDFLKVLKKSTVFNVIALVLSIIGVFYWSIVRGWFILFWIDIVSIVILVILFILSIVLFFTPNELV